MMQLYWKLPPEILVMRPRPNRVLLAWLNRNEITFKAAAAVLGICPNRLRALATGGNEDNKNTLQFELLERLRAHYGK